MKVAQANNEEYSLFGANQQLTYSLYIITLNPLDVRWTSFPVYTQL
jgi:hypothetical protein